MKKNIKKIVFALAVSFCMISASAGDEGTVDSSTVVFPSYGDDGYKLAVKKTERFSAVLPNLDEKAAADLVGGKVISFGNGSGEDLTKYVPSSSAAAKKLAAAPQGKQGFAVVSCAIIPYPASWKNMSADEKLLSLYNALGRVSAQKGITYISRRAGYKPKTLFTRSYYIADTEHTENALADPVASEVPSSDRRYVFQEDTSFGENTYLHTYTDSASEIFVEITNCTPMKYHGVTCLKEREMEMCISAYPLEEGIFFSSAAIVTGQKQTVTVLFIKVDLADAFKRRTDALYEWFLNQINN
ncbi:DUF6675 family protein [Treponema socranskii]|uniref:DUF6675 family protein n=1 Tax=Treponema socranskii TaxID=53419 RepID=UPI0028710769|nr:DUF6675 family protein [Treponema socranskii]MDR9858691.1 DUF6675 family protein [Treponema socranskii]